MIEDSRGNQFEGDLSSVFKQMSGKTVSQPVPDANKGKDNSAVYKEMGDLLKKLNANFNTKELSSAINHLNSVVNMAKSSQMDLKQTLSGEFKSIDNSLSKMLGGFGSIQNSLDKVGTTISSSLGKALGNASKNSGGGDLKNITGTLMSLAKNLVKSLGSGKPSSSPDSSIRELQEFSKMEKAEKSLRTKNYTALSEYAKRGSEPGSNYTHDIHQEEYNKQIVSLLQGLMSNSISQVEFDRQLIKLNSNTRAQSKFNDEGGGTDPSKSRFAQDMSRAVGKIEKMGVLLKSAGDAAGAIIKKVNQIGDAMAFPNTAVTVFGAEYKNAAEAAAGMLKQERQISIEAKKIAYETQGITGANADAQKQFLLYEDTVARTGVSRITFQKQLLEFQRKGIRDQGTIKNILTAQLNIEKQLGMEAGELGDDFVKLHQQSGFTNVQINSTARGMLEVARQSGLSGKELKAAMESSKGVIENMKKAATLTAGAIKNVTLVMAEAQKLGVTENISDLLGNASSSAKLLMGASSETKNLLFMAAGAMGKTTELQQGTLTRTKAGMKSLGDGMLQVAKQFGLESLDQIDTLSDAAKMEMNLQMKANLGVELDEFRRMTQALNEGGKSYQDRLKDIQSKLDNAGKLALTNAEVQALNEQKLLQQRQASLDVITHFDEAIKKAGKSGKNMNQIMDDFGKTVLSDTAQGKELRDSIEAATGKKVGAMTPQEQLQASMAVSMKQVNERLSKAGLGGKAIDENKLVAAMQDPKAFRELTEEMQKLEQEALTKEKASADPALAAELELTKVNEKLSIKAMELGEKVAANIDPMKAVQVALTALGTEMALNTAATIANTVASGIEMVKSLKDMGSFFKGKIFGKGAGEVAEAGATKGAAGLAERFLGKNFAELGKTGGFLTKTLGGFAKRLPLIGGVVDFGSRMMSGESVGRAGTAAVSGVGGGIGGAAVGAAIGSVIPGIGTAIGALVGGLIGSIGASELGGFIFDIKDKIFGFFKWLGGGIGSLFMEYLWNPLSSFFGWVGGGIGTLFMDYFWTPISNMFSWIGTTAIGKVLYDYIWSPIANVFSSIGGFLQNVLGRYWAFITWPFKKLYSFFGDWGPGIWKWIKSVAASIPVVGKYLVGEDKGEAAPKTPTIPSEMSATQDMTAAVSAVMENPAAATALGVSPTAAPIVSTIPSVSGPIAPPSSMAAMASASAGQGGDMGSYLSSIARSGESEVTAAQQMIQLLNKMVELLSGGGGATPATAAAGGKPPLTDNYFKLPTGNFNESSIREVTNL